MAAKIRQRLLAGFDEHRPDPPPAAGARNPAAPPSDLQGKTVYVVDAHALIYQVFHAMPDISGPAGQPVGAVHGFVRDIADLIEKKHPDYLFCAFDAPGDVFRHEIFAEYKIHREAMPDELRPQIGTIRRFLAAMGVPAIAIPGYEADDVMATVARRTESAGGRCVLVTHDKDCRQLITDQTFLYNIRKDQTLDAKFVIDDWGIRPDQVVDFQAMWGDAVDNIPGIPGIGKKTASELLQQYGSLEGILGHVEELAGKKKKENILQSRDQVLVSRELVRLKTDVPVDIDWHAARPGGGDRRAIGELCREFGFRQLADRLAGAGAPAAAREWQGQIELVDSLAELERLIGDLAGQKCVGLALETTGGGPRWCRITGLGIAWKTGSAAFLPFEVPPGYAALPMAVALEKLRPALEDERLAKYGHDLKACQVALRAAGIHLKGAPFDSMVADYLLDAGQRDHGLAAVAERTAGRRLAEPPGGSGRARRAMDELPPEPRSLYSAQSAELVVELRPILLDRLRAEQLEPLFRELEMPLVEVLAALESQGIRIDIALLRELGERFGRRLGELEREIHDLAGGPFNIESPKQLAAILFERLQLPVLKRTKTGPSTDADVLVELARAHPLPAKIIEYRQKAKLKSTYVDALPGLVHPVTGRVHTTLKQDVAATGRLSSMDPNLQNIPVRTEEGREIRAAFLPGFEGWKLLCADYSQIELRVLAHYSGDAALRAAFEQNCDIHQLVASQVYGVSTGAVTSAMRRSAKAINFGIIYGQSPFGLAKALGIEKSDAAAFIDAYFAQYPGVERFMEATLAEGRKNGYVKTTFGRRRAVQGIRDPSRRGDSRQRNLPERIAINTVIQGSAADLIKQAMIRVYRRLSRENLRARMLLQIHDELMFEVPPDELPALTQLVVEEMSGAGDMEVPLRVDVKSGDNWAGCEPVDADVR